MMVTSELQSHGIDVLPPPPPPQAGASWAWLVPPLVLVLALVFAVAIARRRQWSGALRALQRSLRAQRLPPRQAGHRLAKLIRRIPAASSDAWAALSRELDGLRFARDEPAPERLTELIARARKLARQRSDGR